MKSLNFSLLLILSITLVSSGNCQVLDLQPIPKTTTTINLKYVNSLYDQSSQHSFELFLKHPLSKKLNVVSNMAYTTFGNSPDTYNGFGNVYTGAQLKLSNDTTKYSSVNFGVFVPLGQEDATLGALSNFYNLPLYNHEIMTISTQYAYHTNAHEGINLSLELGPDLYIPVDDESSNETELVMHYGLNLRYTKSQFTFFSEILGIAFLTNEGSFNDNSYHSYSVGISASDTNVIVKTFYRNYFDEVFDSIDGYIGISIGVIL